MKIYAINGGPRRGWNTETMLQSFLEGARSVGDSVETEMVYLYDLNYKGCTSCYTCKLDDDALDGRCHVRDDIHQLLWDVPRSDGVVFGSPIYLGDLTAELRAFIERLVYQYSNFEMDRTRPKAPKRLPTAMIYTMNVTKEIMEKAGYDAILRAPEGFLHRAFGIPPVRLCAYNIYQYKDYSRYRASFWNEAEKAEHRRVQFPLDCQAAYDAGRAMALSAQAEPEA